MKKIIMTIGLFCAVCVSALAQNTITMKFTGRNQNNDWIPLSSVLVENQTQRWQELVYYPDTILYMGTVGIDDYMQSEKVHLFQNVPNPFDGVTDFSLQLDEDQNILLEIYDMNGKLVAQYENSLPQGPHLFRATLTSPQTYLLSARTENDRMHIKMVNKGNGGANTIEYLGQGSIQYELKSDSKGSSPYPFVAGDWMKYVGYANLCGAEFVSAPVNKAQNQSETINLIFTLPLPEVTANSATDVTITSAMLNGSANGHDCGLTEHGFCYGTSSGNLNNKVVAPGTADGDFLYDISSLTPGTTYYFKAYAQSITGTAFSSVQSFRTLSTVPTVTTTDVSSILPTSAVSGGNVTADGGATVTARGVCWSTSQNPTVSNSHTTDGSGTGSFSSSITGLNPNTTYYVRAYATNSEGTAYGNQVSFTTLPPSIPTVSTTSVTGITYNAATSGGNVTADGSATVTARGVCWSTSQNPTVSTSHTTDGSGTGSFTSSITGLNPNTTYYVRAYATNSAGTAYGNQVSFTTYNDGQPCPGAAIITDYDNNTYNTVQIGYQCWMKQNLKTTHYSDGTSIPLGGNTTSYDVAYRYYPNNSSSNVSTYGYLYNWKAVMRNSSSSSSNPSGVQGICPTGWHVPSDAEWTQLENYVGSQSAYQCNGSSSNIAKALASATGWNSSTTTCTVGNTPANNNATGFSAVPAGTVHAMYLSFGYEAHFWSATQNSSNFAYYRYLYYNSAGVYRDYFYKDGGYSVRCLRD